MTNFHTQGNFSRLKPSWLVYQEPFYLVFSIANVLLAITATLGNILVLIALYKVSCIHPPTKLLLSCLAATDLCVGLVVQPLFIVSLLEIPSETWIDRYRTGRTFAFMLCGVSMLTTTALSVERLLALLLALRYRYIVNLRRVRVAIVSFWLAAISEGLIYSLYSPYIANYVGFVVTLLSLFISVFSYTKIVLKLRVHQVQMQHQHDGHKQAQGGAINIELYKEILHSIALLQLAMAVCYFPIVLYLIMRATTTLDLSITFENSAMTIIYFNSSLNPILYSGKIREVRKEVKNTLKKICFFSG